MAKSQHKWLVASVTCYICAYIVNNMHNGKMPTILISDHNSSSTEEVEEAVMILDIIMDALDASPKGKASTDRLCYKN